jgi:hypothetical protein
MPEKKDPTSIDEAKEAPKVRRISNKNPAKPSGGDSGGKPEPREKSNADQSEVSAPESNGDVMTDQKRKNRRRRGKGKPSANESELPGENEAAEESDTDSTRGEATAASSGKDKEKPESPNRPRVTQGQQQNSRQKPDPDKVAKNAWKIFLAEVSEEGVALIGDNDARELTRRCFRLAEIFMEEKDRRG